MGDIPIIGNGSAAHRLVERLRHHGHQGPITVLGAEKRPAYNRVLLTSVLRRTLPPEAVTLPALPAGTQVRLGVIATGIDQMGYHYDELVLATRARPQIPDLPGVLTADGYLADGVTTLWTRADCERISRAQWWCWVVESSGWKRRSVCWAAATGSLWCTPTATRWTVTSTPGGRLLADHLNELGVSMQLGRKAVEYTLGKLFLDDGQVLETDTLIHAIGDCAE